MKTLAIAALVLAFDLVASSPPPPPTVTCPPELQAQVGECVTIPFTISTPLSNIAKVELRVNGVFVSVVSLRPQLTNPLSPPPGGFRIVSQSP